ncbi:hypothetical protein FIV42_00980 [Persicimonas caeni]|uniref:Transposase DDE domain-containing protein n=1 Tax=Persicimonas caeni TaxID=2292766 RepID=A0A4Y6PMV4_PERCE|nr:hypothetical protein [Persicimonas caeni]QDG49185.1 hypothetical protein FIV42_00055 [Persicimonas caeni]QDG49357.1 hypothetical protein FIV42_00980 [Persicimonas caeni]QED30406.1 hypothetical protein FRD00_00050 [Persicimonas caeni]QED30578.1 hypothetical protein FRD00_00975 [Persicimonas caeni]
MPDTRLNVSLQNHERSEPQRAVPAHFNEYIVACEHLRGEGIFDEIEQQFRLDRSGYQFIDAVLAGLAFFSAQPTYSGLRGMLDEVNGRGWSQALAAAGGRDRLCSQASMSRVLGDIPEEMACRFKEQLLGAWTPAAPFSAYEAVLWRDCTGQSWHGFAIDGRVQPFRRRALCEGEEYPPARRRVDSLGAKPGYSGRKRADVQMETSILEHLGSGLYLAMNYAAGNGQLSDDFAQGLALIERWANARGLEPGRCFLAIDGHQGGFAQLRAALRSPVHFLTRLRYYEPLKDPAVRAQLAQQTWQKVDDSRSGPQRWATEMGDYWLGDARARLVVSCFEPTDGKKRGAGCFVDGLQYEVYACDLDPTAYPAAEVVTTYYARAGRQENGFARLDRHMDLEKMYSDCAPGQQVMMALGVWLHNFRAIRGAELFGELEPIDVEAAPRKLESADTLPLAPTGAPAPHAAPAAGRPEPASLAVGFEASHAWWQSVTRKVEQRIGGLDGFSYDAQTRQIGCAKGAYLGLSGMRQRGGRVIVRFRIGSPQACQGCPFRRECTSSTSPTYRKEIEIHMPPPATLGAHDEPAAIQGQDKAADAPTHGSDPADKASPSTALLGLRLSIPDDLPEPGDLHMRQPVLVASTFRNAFRKAARSLKVEVTKSPPDSSTRHVDYLAMTAARRQRRRKTWDERLQWNSLPQQANITIAIRAPLTAARLLPEANTPASDPPFQNKANR